MAHLDLHEQEQLYRLKYLWRDWGKYIIGILVIVLIAYISNVIWEARVSAGANQAALIFNQLKTAGQIKDSVKVYQLANELENNYPRLEYAVMGSIMAAKTAFDLKDLVKASTYLNWAVKNSKDRGMASLAMLHLADVYIDEKKFDLALNTLMQGHEASFDGLFYSKRGDLYVAKGDLTKARDAYKEAIDKAGQDQNMVSSIQMKLDVLGG